MDLLYNAMLTGLDMYKHRSYDKVRKGDYYNIIKHYNVIYTFLLTDIIKISHP